MRQSFYQYMLTERDPNRKDELTRFAYDVVKDGMFPKQSTSYNEISDYLELNGDYPPSMSIFDKAWDRYIENKH